MKQMWTKALVKAELPRVLVKLGESKHIHVGRVSGRLKFFPTVTVDAHDSTCAECRKSKGYLRGLPWSDFEFAWATIANALNEGKPLRT